MDVRFAVALAILAACGTNEVRLRVGLDGEAEPAYFEARLMAGASCPAEALWRLEAEPAAAPVTVRRGTSASLSWGEVEGGHHVVVLGRSESCEVVSAGCAPLRAGDVSVILSDVSARETACGRDELCVASSCTSVPDGPVELPALASLCGFPPGGWELLAPELLEGLEFANYPSAVVRNGERFEYASRDDLFFRVGTGRWTPILESELSAEGREANRLAPVPGTAFAFLGTYAASDGAESFEITRYELGEDGRTLAPGTDARLLALDALPWADRLFPYVLGRGPDAVIYLGPRDGTLHRVLVEDAFGEAPTVASTEFVRIECPGPQARQPVAVTEDESLMLFSCEDAEGRFAPHVAFADLASGDGLRALPLSLAGDFGEMFEIDSPFILEDPDHCAIYFSAWDPSDGEGGVPGVYRLPIVESR